MPDDAVFRDPPSAWRHLVVLGGLELGGRDEGFAARVLAHLDPLASSLDDALRAASMQQFARAFFASVETEYVAMFRDILAYFERSGARDGKSAFTLAVDGSEFGLDHFRRWIGQWRGSARVVLDVPAVDRFGSWSILSALRQSSSVDDAVMNASAWAAGGQSMPLAPDVAAWIEAYERDLYDPLPTTLEPDALPAPLRDVARVVWIALDRIRSVTTSRTTLLDFRRTASRESFDDADGLAFWNVVQHETDLLLRSLVAALGAVVRLPDSERASVDGALETVLATFPRRSEPVSVSLRDLEAVLSLPLWEKRHELYAVWIATEIVGAIPEHDVELHHDGGRLEFAFRESRLASVHSSRARVALITERRSPLSNPRGAGRVEGVQPDYGLWERNGDGSCRIVVEVKHYKRAAPARFATVLEDYAEALPDADVYLVNHGPVGEPLRPVSPTYAPRCHTIERLTPSNTPARRRLREAIRACVGDPVVSRRAAVAVGARVVVVDVSGSLGTVLASAELSSVLREILARESPTEIVAVNEDVVARWTADEAALRSLPVVSGGGTALADPVRRLLRDAECVVLVTDADGLRSLGALASEDYATVAEPPPDIVVRVLRA